MPKAPAKVASDIYFQEKKKKKERKKRCLAKIFTLLELFNFLPHYNHKLQCILLRYSVAYQQYMYAEQKGEVTFAGVVYLN